MIREILLGVHATAWLIVVLITAWKTGGEVPAQLWAVLPLGVGAIIGAFRAESAIGVPRTGDGHHTKDDHS